MLRKREWWEKNWPEKIFSVFASIVYGAWFVVSRTVYGVYRLLLKLANDVLKTVYGKFVALIAGGIFLWLLAQFSGLIPH